MTAQTLTLTSFLLARIAEDEAVARGAYRDSVDDDGVCHEDWADATTAVMWGDLPAISGLEADYLSNHIARHDPARVLAECEAKRQIVEIHQLANADQGGGVGCMHCDWDREWGLPTTGGCDTLRYLALPYVDHEDYNPDWRP